MSIWEKTFETNCQTQTFIDKKQLMKAFTIQKFPRKIKKAISQMWEKKRVGNKLDVTFTIKHSTHWQRKVARMVKFSDELIYIPMKNGRFLIIDYRKRR